jgi:RNA polymerase primary sigma factor
VEGLRLLQGISAEEEAALVRRIQAHDMQAKRMVVEANMHLVEPLAKRYVGRGIPLADLTLDGSLGLIRAVETYDHRKGSGFTSFARGSIRHAITQVIAKQGGPGRHTQQQSDALVALRRVQEAVLLRVARMADDEKAATGQGGAVRQEANGTDHGEARWLDDLTADEQAVELLREAGADLEGEELHEMLSVLMPRERKAIEQRLGLTVARPRTLDELARTFAFSRQRIQQVEAKATVALRSYRDSQRLIEFLH